MGIRGSKSKSVDITTPGAEVTTPTEAKPSANGGTDLEAHSAKRLENGEQMPAAEEPEEQTTEGEAVTITTTTEGESLEGTAKAESNEIKENGGDAVPSEPAVAVAPIANEEKLEGDAPPADEGKKEEEDQQAAAEEKKRAKEELKREKKEEERKRKEEEKRRKDEEKQKKKEEEKKKKSSGEGKKRSLSFLLKKRNSKKEETTQNGEAEVTTEEKPEGIKEEVKAESAEKSLESDVVQPSALDTSTASEVVTDTSLVHDSILDDSIELAAVPEQAEKAESAPVEKPSTPEKVQVPEVTTTIEPAPAKDEEAAPKPVNTVECEVVPVVSKAAVELKAPEVAAAAAVPPTIEEKVETIVHSSPPAPEPVIKVTPQALVEESLPPPPTPPPVREVEVEVEVKPEPNSKSACEDVIPSPPPTPPPVASEEKAEPEPVQTTQEAEIVPPPVLEEEVHEPVEKKELALEVEELVIPPPDLPEESHQQEQILKEEIATKNGISGKNGCYPIELTWAHGGKTVAVRGSFTEWEKTVELLERDGLFATTLDLSVGEHYFKFQVDGDWKVDNDQPTVQLDGQGEVNVLVVKGDASEE